jgi:predicted metal-binding membrane protein
MLVMAFAPGDPVPWMIALTVIVTAERLLERPRRVTRLSAAALGVTAIGSLLAAVI